MDQISYTGSAQTVNDDQDATLSPWHNHIPAETTPAAATHKIHALPESTRINLTYRQQPTPHQQIHMHGRRRTCPNSYDPNTTTPTSEATLAVVDSGRCSGGSVGAGSREEHMLQLEGRCSAMAGVNTLLRGQLHAAQDENEHLTSQLQKLRQQVEDDNQRHRNEEQMFSEYYNAEHRRLLLLWKSVVDFRQCYNQLRSQTEDDLERVRDDVGQCVVQLTDLAQNIEKPVIDTIDSVDTGRINLTTDDQYRSPKETRQSDDRDVDKDDQCIASLRCELERSKMENIKNNMHISDMEHIVQDLQKKLAEAIGSNNDDALFSLQQSIGEIHTLLDEDESRIKKLGQNNPAQIYSKGSTVCDSIKTADKNETNSSSVVASIRSRLLERHAQLHSLLVKLTNSEERLKSATSRLEEEEISRTETEKKLETVSKQLIDAEMQHGDASKQLERRQSELMAINDEIDGIRSSHLSLEQQISKLTSRCETKDSTIDKLENKLDITEHSLHLLQKELDSTQDQLDRSLQTERENNAKVEGLTQIIDTLKNDLKGQKAEYDILVKDNSIILESLAKRKLDNEELSARVIRLTSAESCLKNSLLKLTNHNEGLTTDTKDLHQLVQQLSAEQAILKSERSILESEVDDQREQINRLDKEKSRIVAEKFAIQEKHIRLAEEKGSLENELDELRADLTHYESKYNFNEKELERLNLQISRQHAEYDDLNAKIINYEKEKHNLLRLTESSEEKNIALESDMTNFRESLASSRSECVNLEMQIYELRSEIEASAVQRMQLQEKVRLKESENDDVRSQLSSIQRTLTTELERLNVDVSKSRQKLDATLKDKENTVRELEKSHSETIILLKREHKEIIEDLERRLQKSQQSWTIEQDEMIMKKETKIHHFQQEIERIKRMHENQLKSIEDAKQQAISMAMSEKAIDKNQLKETKLELDKCRNDLLKLKSEHSDLIQSSRTQIHSLQTDVSRVSDKLNAKHTARQKEVEALNAQIQDLKQMKEIADSSAAQMKIQISVSEKQRTNLEKELNDSVQKHRNTERQLEKLNTTLNDTNRKLQETKEEKMDIESSNQILITKLKTLENDNSHISRTIDEKKQIIQDLNENLSLVEQELKKSQSENNNLESARADLHHDYEELKRRMHRVEQDYKETLNEVSHLKVKISKGQESNEDLQKEISVFERKLEEAGNEKSILLDSNMRLESTLVESKHNINLIENEMNSINEEKIKSFGKLEEERRKHESQMEESRREIYNLQVKLESIEQNKESLSQKLDHLLNEKRMLESKISSIGSSLGRIPGLKLSGVYSNGMNYKFNNTGERCTPLESDPTAKDSHNRFSIVDFDPQVIKSSIDDIIQQSLKLKHDNSELMERIHSNERELKSVRFVLSECQTRLEDKRENSNILQEKLQRSEAEISKYKMELKKFNEESKQHHTDTQMLKDQMSRLERFNVQIVSERQSAEEKLGALRLREAQLEKDLQLYHQKSRDQDSKLLQLETTKNALENELQQCQLVIHERNDDLKQLSNHLTTAQRAVQTADERARSLATDVDRMSRGAADSEFRQSELQQQLQQTEYRLQQCRELLGVEREQTQRLQRQVGERHQEHALAQQKLDDFVKVNTELERQNELFNERLVNMQRQLNSESLSRSQQEIDARKKKHEHEQRSVLVDDLKKKILLLESEKRDTSESLATLQKSLLQIKDENRILSDQIIKLDKQRESLVNALDKVEADKEIAGENAHRSSQQCLELDQTVEVLQSKCDDLQASNNHLKQQLNQSEDASRTINKSVGLEQARSLENLQIRCLQLEHNAEVLQQRHRQKVAGLEEQVQVLKQQLHDEISRRHSYVTRSARAGREIRAIRHELDDSLRVVSGSAEPLESGTLDAEMRRLDDTMVRHGGGTRVPTPRTLRSRTVSPNTSGARQTLATPRPAVRTRRQHSATR